MADSSGQYAGEVSWDELRNAWIPKWAEKLKIGDLAEGEVPNTNPADFKVKKRDAWGNKIGWYGGRMWVRSFRLWSSCADPTQVLRGGPSIRPALMIGCTVERTNFVMYNLLAYAFTFSRPST
jgi:hypothetical protein